MDRLIASNTVAVGSGDTAPATGTPGQATSGNPATNTPATVFPAYAFNALQEELIAVIVGAGLTPARNTWNQLLTAIQTIIQSGVSNVCTDTGAANAYVTTLTPALSAPVAGSPFWVKVKTTNTGASTLNATGTAYPLVGGAHAALQGNELVANGWALIDWNATLNSYVLFECTGASVQVAPATQSNHAVQLGQTFGHQALITANGTWTVPAGVTTIYVTAEPGGCGGGGSGSAITSGTNSSASGGAAGGSKGTGVYKQPVTVVPFQVLTATIGAAGSGGTGSSGTGVNATSGNAGGATSLTGSAPTVNISCASGSGGGASANSGNALITIGAVGGNTGSAGSPGLILSAAAVGGGGGAGAGSVFGPGGGAPGGAGATGNGVQGKSGVGYGSCGSGAAGASVLNGTGTSPGANGGPGIAGAILIEW